MFENGFEMCFWKLFLKTDLKVVRKKEKRKLVLKGCCSSSEELNSVAKGLCRDRARVLKGDVLKEGSQWRRFEGGFERGLDGVWKGERGLKGGLKGSSN